MRRPFDANESYLDEAIAYPLACVGLGTQLYYGFRLAFPLNLVLLPLTVVEWILEWQVVFGTPTG